MMVAALTNLIATIIKMFIQFMPDEKANPVFHFLLPFASVGKLIMLNIFHNSSFSRIISAIVFIALFSFFERSLSFSSKLSLRRRLKGSRLSSEPGRPTFRVTMS